MGHRKGWRVRSQREDAVYWDGKNEVGRIRFRKRGIFLSDFGGRLCCYAKNGNLEVASEDSLVFILSIG